MVSIPNQSAIHPVGMVAGVCTVSTANTNRDGSGSCAVVIDGGDYGVIVSRFLAKARVTTTAGMLRLYLEQSARVLIYEFTVEAITVAASTAAWWDQWLPEGGYEVPPGCRILASTHNAEAINVVASGTRYGGLPLVGNY